MVKTDVNFSMIFSLWGENRRVLREIEAIGRLLDVLATPTLGDLHVMVVMVLANLLEDTESLEVRAVVQRQFTPLT